MRGIYKIRETVWHSYLKSEKLEVCSVPFPYSFQQSTACIVSDGQCF